MLLSFSLYYCIKHWLLEIQIFFKKTNLPLFTNSHLLKLKLNDADIDVIKICKWQIDKLCYVSSQNKPFNKKFYSVVL